MNDINQRLQQGMMGKKQINPDERNKYLGQLKERLYISATFADSKDSHFLTNIDSLLEDKEAILYLNSNLPQSLQTNLIQCVMKNNRSFTVVTNDKNQEDDICLVYADKVATHLPSDCAYSVLFKDTQTTKAQEETKPKKSILKRLFHH